MTTNHNKALNKAELEKTLSSLIFLDFLIDSTHSESYRFSNILATEAAAAFIRVQEEVRIKEKQPCFP